MMYLVVKSLIVVALVASVVSIKVYQWENENQPPDDFIFARLSDENHYISKRSVGNVSILGNIGEPNLPTDLQFYDDVVSEIAFGEGSNFATFRGPSFESNIANYDVAEIRHRKTLKSNETLFDGYPTDIFTTADDLMLHRPKRDDTETVCVNPTFNRVDECIESLDSKVSEKCYPDIKKLLDNMENGNAKNSPGIFTSKEIESELCVRRVFSSCLYDERYRIKTKIKKVIGLNVDIDFQQEYEMDCCDESLMEQVIENVKDCFAKGEEFDQQLSEGKKDDGKDLAYNVLKVASKCVEDHTAFKCVLADGNLFRNTIKKLVDILREQGLDIYEKQYGPDNKGKDLMCLKWLYYDKLEKCEPAFFDYVLCLKNGTYDEALFNEVHQCFEKSLQSCSKNAVKLFIQIIAGAVEGQEGEEPGEKPPKSPPPQLSDEGQEGTEQDEITTKSQPPDKGGPSKDACDLKVIEKWISKISQCAEKDNQGSSNVEDFAAILEKCVAETRPPECRFHKVSQFIKMAQALNEKVKKLAPDQGNSCANQLSRKEIEKCLSSLYLYFISVHHSHYTKEARDRLLNKANLCFLTELKNCPNKGFIEKLMGIYFVTLNIKAPKFKKPEIMTRVTVPEGFIWCQTRIVTDVLTIPPTEKIATPPRFTRRKQETHSTVFETEFGVTERWRPPKTKRPPPTKFITRLPKPGGTRTQVMTGTTSKSFSVHPQRKAKVHTMPVPTTRQFTFKPPTRKIPPTKYTNTRPPLTGKEFPTGKTWREKFTPIPTVTERYTPKPKMHGPERVTPSTTIPVTRQLPTRVSQFTRTGPSTKHKKWTVPEKIYTQRPTRSTTKKRNVTLPEITFWEKLPYTPKIFTRTPAPKTPATELKPGYTKLVYISAPGHFTRKKEVTPGKEHHVPTRTTRREFITKTTETSIATKRFVPTPKTEIDCEIASTLMITFVETPVTEKQTGFPEFPATFEFPKTEKVITEEFPFTTTGYATVPQPGKVIKERGPTPIIKLITIPYSPETAIDIYTPVPRPPVERTLPGPKHAVMGSTERTKKKIKFTPPGRTYTDHRTSTTAIMSDFTVKPEIFTQECEEMPVITFEVIETTTIRIPTPRTSRRERYTPPTRVPWNYIQRITPLPTQTETFPFVPSKPGPSEKGVPPTRLISFTPPERHTHRASQTARPSFTRRRTYPGGKFTKEFTIPQPGVFSIHPRPSTRRELISLTPSFTKRYPPRPGPDTEECLESTVKKIYQIPTERPIVQKKEMTTVAFTIKKGPRYTKVFTKPTTTKMNFTLPEKCEEEEAPVPTMEIEIFTIIERPQVQTYKATPVTQRVLHPVTRVGPSGTTSIVKWTPPQKTPQEEFFTPTTAKTFAVPVPTETCETRMFDTSIQIEITEGRFGTGEAGTRPGPTFKPGPGYKPRPRTFSESITPTTVFRKTRTFKPFTITQKKTGGPRVTRVFKPKPRTTAFTHFTPETEITRTLKWTFVPYVTETEKIEKPMTLIVTRRPKTPQTELIPETTIRFQRYTPLFTPITEIRPETTVEIEFEESPETPQQKFENEYPEEYEFYPEEETKVPKYTETTIGQETFPVPSKIVTEAGPFPETKIVQYTVAMPPQRETRLPTTFELITFPRIRMQTQNFPTVIPSKITNVIPTRPTRRQTKHVTPVTFSRTAPTRPPRTEKLTTQTVQYTLTPTERVEEVPQRTVVYQCITPPPEKPVEECKYIVRGKKGCTKKEVDNWSDKMKICVLKEVEKNNGRIEDYYNKKKHSELQQIAKSCTSKVGNNNCKKSTIPLSHLVLSNHITWVGNQGDHPQNFTDKIDDKTRECVIQIDENNLEKCVPGLYEALNSLILYNKPTKFDMKKEPSMNCLQAAFKHCSKSSKKLLWRALQDAFDICLKLDPALVCEKKPDEEGNEVQLGYDRDDSDFEEDADYGNDDQGNDENYEVENYDDENYDDYCDEGDGNCDFDKYTVGDNQNDQKCDRSEVDKIYKAMQTCMKEKIGSDSKVPEILSAAQTCLPKDQGCSVTDVEDFRSLMGLIYCFVLKVDEKDACQRAMSDKPYQECLQTVADSLPGNSQQSDCKELYRKTEECLKQALGQCGPDASKKLTDIIFGIIGSPSKGDEGVTQRQHEIMKANPKTKKPPGATLTTFKKTATKVSVCYHYFRTSAKKLDKNAPTVPDICVPLEEGGKGDKFKIKVCTADEMTKWLTSTRECVEKKALNIGRKNSDYLTFDKVIMLVKECISKDKGLACVAKVKDLFSTAVKTLLQLLIHNILADCDANCRADLNVEKIHQTCLTVMFQFYAVHVGQDSEQQDPGKVLSCIERVVKRDPEPIVDMIGMGLQMDKEKIANLSEKGLLEKCPKDYTEPEESQPTLPSLLYCGPDGKLERIELNNDEVQNRYKRSLQRKQADMNSSQAYACQLEHYREYFDELKLCAQGKLRLKFRFKKNACRRNDNEEYWTALTDCMIENIGSELKCKITTKHQMSEFLHHVSQTLHNNIEIPKTTCQSEIRCYGAEAPALHACAPLYLQLLNSKKETPYLMSVINKAGKVANCLTSVFPRCKHELQFFGLNFFYLPLDLNYETRISTGINLVNCQDNEHDNYLFPNCLGVESENNKDYPRSIKSSETCMGCVIKRVGLCAWNNFTHMSEGLKGDLGRVNRCLKHYAENEDCLHDLTTRIQNNCLREYDRFLTSIHKGIVLGALDHFWKFNRCITNFKSICPEEYKRHAIKLYFNILGLNTAFQSQPAEFHKVTGLNF